MDVYCNETYLEEFTPTSCLSKWSATWKQNGYPLLTPVEHKGDCTNDRPGFFIFDLDTDGHLEMCCLTGYVLIYENCTVLDAVGGNDRLLTSLPSDTDNIKINGCFYKADDPNYNGEDPFTVRLEDNSLLESQMYHGPTNLSGIRQGTFNKGDGIYYNDSAFATGFNVYPNCDCLQIWIIPVNRDGGGGGGGGGDSGGGT
jgi:hypothetical protein